MDKYEAVEYLTKAGRKAEVSDGVVIVTTEKTGKALGKEFRKIQKELKSVGYEASFGMRSVLKEGK